MLIFYVRSIPVQCDVILYKANKLLKRDKEELNKLGTGETCGLQAKLVYK